MKISIELTDGQLSAAKKELRVAHATYKLLVAGQVPVSEAEIYAHRILTARRILDISNSPDEACVDYEGKDIEQLL